jgi:hypothetical protein
MKRTLLVIALMLGTAQANEITWEPYDPSETVPKSDFIEVLDMIKVQNGLLNQMESLVSTLADELQACHERKDK